MPQVIFSPEAIIDLKRLREFLRPKNHVVAKRAAKSIISSLQSLNENPHIGRPIEGLSENFRDWLIDFGNSGYVARYRIQNDVILVLAIRHQKEAGF